MPARLPLLPCLLALLLLPGAARSARAGGFAAFLDTTCHYAYGDTLTVIWKPLATMPALLRPCDPTGMADFDTVIGDLNLIHPEFILHTGDLVNEGELEEYYSDYEMGRALGMVYRLRDPMFLSSGNHDIGGWQPTPPPAGTSRKNWWRYFGWPFLASPPAGAPYHSQDYSFDYDSLHVICLEAYLNNGSCDNYLPATYGGGSFTTEQLNWLNQDIAA